MIIKVRKFFIIVSLILIGGTALFSQELSKQVQFQHISSNEYFSVGNVWDIMEDHEGYIWFATEDGLLRYDGYVLKAYKNIHDDPASVSANFILCVFEDSKKNFWVGTLGGGLNLFSRSENRFYSFTHNPEIPGSIANDRIKSILEDDEGRLWFGTEGGGISMLETLPDDITKTTFKTFNNQEDSPIRIAGNHVRASLAKDQKGNIYVGSYESGISIIDYENSTVRYLRHEDDNPNSLSDDNIYELFVDSKNRLWIGTQKNGLDLYLIDEERFIHYPSTKERHTLNNGEIETITEDQEGNIWVGTDNGLSLLIDSNSPVPGNDFLNFVHEPQDEKSILSNSIKKVYVDRKNSLWVGSYYGGINMFNRDNFKFTSIRKKSWLRQSLSSNNVTSFAEDHRGNIWIGTDGGGLNLLSNGLKDIYQDNYQKIELINPYTGESQNKIKALAVDQSDNLWIGTWASGFFKYNLNNGKYHYYGIDDPSFNFKAFSVLALEVDKDNNVWIGTLTDGLAYYDQKKDTFQVFTSKPGNPHHFSSERINTILADSQNRIWVGGELGSLNLYHREDNTFETILYENILTSKNNIITLTETNEGNIIIGTLSGIVHYNPTTKEAIKFNTLIGFPDDVIHGILQDEQDNYWISTNQGITVFNKENGSIISFNRNDGLQGNYFNNKSVFKASNGWLYFGGTNGWNGFNPKNIGKSNNVFPIVFTNFYIDREEVITDNNGTPILPKINSNGSLYLNHYQTNIGFEVAILEYNFSNLNNYSYWLEGLNYDWQKLGTDRKIFFTNLFPGEYTLRIRATNKDGFWHEMLTPLTIYIQPAWWQTKWFILLVVISLFILIWSIFRTRTNFLIKQKKKLEKTVEERTLELTGTNKELIEKNYEIQAQNEELSAQNDQIVEQREELEVTQEKLKKINLELENIVDKRTKNLKTTIKKLDKTVKELDRFIYSASHDLSAPMKSIRGLIDVASKEKDPENIRACLTHIKYSANRFEEVISNLIDYSRNAHLKVKLVTIDLHQKVESVFTELKFWPEASGISFFNEIGRESVVVTDETRLDNVLRNLINNSVKYADGKKEKPFIKVSGMIHDGMYAILVEDNGVGIEPENQKKIFDMFFRASEKSSGSGLGLYIVKESIQTMNGKITVESTPGIGTTFTVDIPQ